MTTQITSFISRHKMAFLITFLALILRVWQLGNYPPDFTPDEAALGYNAYSIIHTGRDENNQLYPVIFESFGDYKPGLYIYLSIPWIMMLGLNETSVRLTSALAGTLAVFLIYVVLRLVRNELPYAFLKNHSPIFAALILAINPWHIHFSRGAWESNVALTMILLGLVCILYAIKRRYTHLIVLAGLILGLTLSTYQGAKLSTPIFVLSFILAYFKTLKRRLTLGYVMLASLVALAIAMPVIQTLIDGRIGRLDVYSIFNYHRPQEYVEEFYLRPLGVQLSDLSYTVFQGEWFATLRNVFLRYAQAFSPRYLFIDGDWEHVVMSTPYQGALYWLDSIFLIIGIITAIRINSRFWRFILIWLILSPLPSAFSRDPINAVRSLPLVIPLTLLVGFGYCQLIRLIKLNLPYLYKPSIAVFLAVQLVMLAYFIDLQLYVRPAHLTTGSYYGYKQVVAAVAKYRAQNIPVTMSQSYSQPYIYFLFFEKTDPRFVQQNLVRVPNPYGDVGLVTSVGPGLRFQETHWEHDKQFANNVFISDSLIRLNAQNSSDPDLYEAQEITSPVNKSLFRIVYIK